LNIVNKPQIERVINNRIDYLFFIRRKNA